MVAVGLGKVSRRGLFISAKFTVSIELKKFGQIKVKRAIFQRVKTIFKTASDGKKIPKPKLLIKPDPRFYVFLDGSLRLTSGKQLGFRDYRLYF